jgi:hypothetical protein
VTPRNPYHRKAGRPKPERLPTREEIARGVRDLKAMGAPDINYRERSLELHGMICAKCAREFTEKDRHQLTVHHIDGNDKNNPPDGSNWENLCIYCHEAEHSRGRLGDYLRGDD